MMDALQSAKTRAERYARNMIYPGGKLHMSYYTDREVGDIYIAIGKGDVAVDRFGREPCLGEAVTSDMTLIKDVWRGVWMGAVDGKWRGTRVNCIAGDWSADQAMQDIIGNAKETLKAMR